MHAVLDAVMLFCALRVIPAVDGTDQIAGDAADAFKLLRLQRIVNVNFTVIGRRNMECVQFFTGLLFYILDIIYDFLLRNVLQSIYRYVDAIYYHGYHLSFLICVRRFHFYKTGYGQGFP